MADILTALAVCIVAVPFLAGFGLCWLLWNIIDDWKV